MLHYEKELDVKQLNSLALAYIGDAVFEVYVRELVLYSGITKPRFLHKEATRFVSAKAQADIIHYLLDEELLSDEEAAIVRRGRNAKSSTVPKNTDVQTYRYGTAFEALIGYLFLMRRNERLEEVIELAIRFIQDKKGGAE